MTCEDCIHNEVCYRREISNDIEEQIKELGCMDFIARADVQEIKHGEWVEDGYYDIPCVCSCCGAEAQYISTFEETFDYDWEENLCPTGYEETREYIRTPYCSHCGAKMDGDTNDEL